jgi:hypothetical protein
MLSSKHIGSVKITALQGCVGGHEHDFQNDVGFGLGAAVEIGRIALLRTSLGKGSQAVRKWAVGS